MYNYRNVGALPFEEEDYKKFAKPRCNKCYGRGYTGHRVHMDEDGKPSKKRSIILCKCVDLRALSGALQMINEKMKEEASKMEDKKSPDKKETESSKKQEKKEEKVNMVPDVDKIKESDKGVDVVKSSEEKCT